MAPERRFFCKLLKWLERRLFSIQREYYFWYFADVVAYLLKKEVEKIRLQVLFRL